MVRATGLDRSNFSDKVRSISTNSTLRTCRTGILRERVAGVNRAGGIQKEKVKGKGKGSTRSNSTSSSISTCSSTSTSASASTSSFQPRLKFPLPSSVPSWYAGHMHRAIRSMPTLLLRHPPPLVIEARDSRLPLTSINPAFDRLLKHSDQLKSKSMSKSILQSKQGLEQKPHQSQQVEWNWEKRRLVVYTKKDLVDPVIQRPLIKAFEKHGDGQEIMFVDTRQDKDVKRVINWIKERAKLLSTIPTPTSQVKLHPSRTKRLAGAFRHTPTPEVGIRLIILGMPNVGKSSLLNSLRRVGAGKGGKAASTAPHPGHTKKLMGTVRITPDVLKKPNFRSSRDESNEEEVHDGEVGKIRDLKKEENPIYVYDTPGVMVPFLGRGEVGAEKGVRLAVAAGIKSSLFDTQGLADYLLYRFNLRYYHALRKWKANGSVGDEPLPIYRTALPQPRDESSQKPTNSVLELLSKVAERAPGTLNKGGERDLDSAAEFIINRWRDGKLGDCELDLKLNEWDESVTDQDAGSEETETIGSKIDRLVKEHFQRVRESEDENQEVYTSPTKSSNGVVDDTTDSDSNFDFGNKSDLLMETIESSTFKQAKNTDSQSDSSSSSSSSDLPLLLSNHQFKKSQKIKAILEKEKKTKRSRKSSDWSKSKIGSKKKWGGGSSNK